MITYARKADRVHNKLKTPLHVPSQLSFTNSEVHSSKYIMESRPTKRTRQACEPCRSSEVTQPREPPNLLTAVQKPDELLFASIQQPTSATTKVAPPAYESRSRNDLQRFAPYSHTNPISSSSRELKAISSGISLPPLTIVGLVETYIRRCDCQPLSIFDVDNLRSTSDSYKPEVLLSILALALRFSDSNQVPGDSMQLAVQYAERTRQIVMQKIIDENVDMSTLQALCLQAFFDITTANVQRAWLSIGIGMRLITSVQMPLNPEVLFDQAAIDEYRRCFWGFYMLECLCSDASKGRLSLPHEKPPFPPSLSVKSAHGPPTILRKFGDYSSGQTQDKGIMGYSIQLVELWKDSLHYVLGSLNSSEVPWSSGSGYFDMSASVMEWETYLCQNHRSAHAMFSEQSPTDLLMNIRYWGPWLNVQFTYHGTLCLVNNPFWLFEKMKSNAGMAPTSFLETASDLALLHAKHIARLIETLGNRNFESSDPFLGYCAAIACITHLWYCHVEDRSVKDQAQARFAICYGFVAKLGSKWPNVKIIVSILSMRIKPSIH
ncbi:C6 transcription factor protein [Rutstroemia sp. NJR-2017a BBW]|nr:C6 transcription factor protein [Rutstroemia sp. NJR-2017a BBW]